MSLPSQDVLDDIKELISEITGFKEDDENFAICERYCLSHVVYHTYPFVSKTTVLDSVNNYISRFYGHGYFKVSQELNNQVKSFLSNEKLFEKNPQYDIQWCLLSLISLLSSNLTSVKKVPHLLQIDDNDSEIEDFDWKEYLVNDLPKAALMSNNEDEELSWEEDNSDEEDADNDEVSEKTCSGNSINSITETTNEKLCQDKKNLHVIFDNKTMFNIQISSEVRKKRIEEFLKSRRSARDLECDLRVRGNITEIFDMLMNKEGIVRKTQLISEFEVMENILFQFQTGERIFLRKGLVNPALTSLTQEALGSFLESLQPYFKIIRCFKDFDAEVTEARYPGNCLKTSFSDVKGCESSATVGRSRKIPNVLHMYNVMLKKTQEPFQNEVTRIVENLGNYTLIQMEQKLKSYYGDLTFLSRVHNSATKNWKKDCNWKSSIRILSVLYNAIMDATSTKMSFLCLNLFLHCFQVYLDIMDSWISCVDLIDPNDEFIVTKSEVVGNIESTISEYKIRSYKTEIEDLWVDKVVILDLISEKMIHVGQSLEVLKRLNRFVEKETQTSSETSYHLLVRTINEKIFALGKVDSIPKNLKPTEKQRSIFTVRNINLRLERDNGGGDSSHIGNLLMEILKEDDEKKEEKNPKKEEKEMDKSCSFSREFMNSMVGNPFFRVAFDSVGIKQVQKQLERAKTRKKEDFEEKNLMIIQKPEEGKSGIYPLHKIITEAFHTVLENRVSGACTLVKDIVLKECNLPTYLALLRSILLFNDSYLLEPFVLAVFTQPVIWGNSYSLSFHLKECVRSFYKNFANDLSVTVSKNGPMRCENVLHVIDAITVTYEVKWPLTLIITPEAMSKYNVIFRLALKVKWAHWALCNLHFEDLHIRQGHETVRNPSEARETIKDYQPCNSDLCSDIPHFGRLCAGSKSFGHHPHLMTIDKKVSIRHRLQLLRFWLLSDVGRISNYLLAQMNPSNLNLNSCNDLKDIIEGHSQFLGKIYHNCLFGEKSAEGKKLILNTLIPLCLDLLDESGDMNETKLSSIEKTFESCHLLLSQLLSSLEK